MSPATLRTHSESPANLLIHLGLNSARFSEYALISLKVLPDFDSAIRRFDPSRPSQPLAQLEIVDILWAKTLHFTGFLRIRGESLISGKWQL
jgi:hypothetical protein